MKRDFLQGVAEARDLFPTLSRLDAGCLYLDAEDNVCLPDAGRLASGELRLHEATIYGAWPETYAWRGPSTRERSVVDRRRSPRRIALYRAGIRSTRALIGRAACSASVCP